MKSETRGKDLPASPACGYISKTGGNSAHVNENCPPGMTGLWLSAWYAGRLVSAQEQNQVLRDFGVCSGSLYMSGSYPADDLSLLFRTSKDGASLIHM